MKNKILILFFILIFLGKVTGAISCVVDRDEITVCDSQEEGSSEDGEEGGDVADEDNSDDLYHQKEPPFRLGNFTLREKFKVFDFFIPSHYCLEITSPPPEA